jgi:hypothetical protein
VTALLLSICADLKPGSSSLVVVSGDGFRFIGAGATLSDKPEPRYATDRPAMALWNLPARFRAARLPFYRPHPKRLPVAPYGGRMTPQRSRPPRLLSRRIVKELVSAWPICFSQTGSRG